VYQKITLAIVLLLAPSALAQYGGGGGGGGQHHNRGGSGSGPTPDTSSGDIKGFERAVALQATSDQVAQFRTLMASTSEARKRTQEMLQLAVSGKSFGNADKLADAIEEAQSDNQKFLQGFSKEQEEGLKKLTKKLRKSDSELSGQTKALVRGVERRTSDDQLAPALQKLEKTLSDFQSDQLAVAAEMGIQDQTNSEQPQSQPVGALQRL
jgi:vacuolar-type H+-ATPase subunit H